MGKRPRDEAAGASAGAEEERERERERARRTTARDERRRAKAARRGKQQAAEAESEAARRGKQQAAEAESKAARKEARAASSEADSAARKAARRAAKRREKEARKPAAPAWQPSWAAAASVPLGCRAVLLEGLHEACTQGEVRAALPRATKVNVGRGKARVTFLEAADVAAVLKGCDARGCIVVGRTHGVRLKAEDPAAVAAEQQAAAEGREVFVKYLPYTATEQAVADLFAACDLLGEPRLMRDPATQQCKGCGWVTLRSEAGHRKALALSGTKFGGRTISVTAATNSIKWARGTVQDAGTHTPAMVDETLRALVLPDPDGVYVDGTFGRGGHSRAILSRLSPKGRLHAFDLDPEAIAVAKELEREDSRFTIHHRPFGDMLQALGEELHGGVSGVFLDLGISSPQFDAAGRGFRPEADGPLDLRFDQTRGVPAHKLLQTVGRDELIDILVRGGEADQTAARRIADAVALAARAGTLPGRTRPFAELVARAKGKEYQNMHPAKMAFQALRIHLNQEFEEMGRGMSGALALLNDGGRLGLLTWKHSECQIVMDFYREHEEAREGAPLVRWLREQHPALTTKLSSAPALSMDDVRRPSSREVQENSRSRSALLHVLRKRSSGPRLYDVEKAAYSLLGWAEPPEPSPPPPPRPW